ncbi:TonB-dependent receptor [Chitinophaga nivalis]|uniref:Carboxypeptidase-like regulatory domain-containing protein n=1 Tax=Chitinophaga nivalis TaxID=2991709 RepID=A0ABT3IJU7_9BACT|nr:TonB-dependent receptor [Chitinophaga nivalis]MCW3466074.1 carboxypeptidase-like regulatory domain-containing protein [Chitinophaga nivalis]MCW3484235.1 carboxypeptidase-like regulatory domain-containing protein [Chitinophaga nivalis]
MQHRQLIRYFFFLLCSVMCMWRVRAQTPPQSIRLHNTTITVAELIKTVEAQTLVRFSYGSGVTERLTAAVKVKAATISLQDVLEAIRTQTSIQYSIFSPVKVVLKMDKKEEPKKNGVEEEEGTTFHGLVTDAESGVPLPGSSITIGHSRRGTATNEKGIFSLQAPATNTLLVISHVGYDRKEVQATGTTFLQIKLALSKTSLNEVTVSAVRNHHTDAALLSERRKAAVISDGIAAQQIERTASITTAQALQRVTGVSITDDKYVAIRGLGDRSVIAELNGARLSSADPDRSTVPLDLIPAGLLDNITVYKTLTPDRSADAAAGIVELKTKSVPTQRTLEVTAQVGFNSNVGLNGKYNGFYNDNLGFWGQRVKTHALPADFLQLSNQYPGGLIQMQELFIQSRNNPAMAKEAMRISNIMQGFDPVLTTSYKNASPNQLYGITFGDSYKVFGRHKLGLIMSANYYQRYEDVYNGERNQYSLYQGVVTGSGKIFNQLHIPGFITPAYPRLGHYIAYNENTGKRTINYGGLIGVAYQFTPQHVVQFQFVGSRGAEAIASNLTGQWKNTGLNFPVYNIINQLKLTYRTFDTYNIQGEHKFLQQAWSPRLTYNLSTSKTVQDEPDFRSSNYAQLRTVQQMDPNGVGIGTDTYAFVTGLTHGLGNDYASAIIADPNGRQFRKLYEDNYHAKVDLTQPFTIRGLQQVIKIGGAFLRRERDYRENILGLPGSNLGGGGDLLGAVKGDINRLVSTRYVGLKDPAAFDEEGQPRVGGFLYQIKKSPNNYTGAYETRAFYFMADAHVSARLRITGGVRFESTVIEASVDTNQVYLPPMLDLASNLPGVSVRNITDKPFSNYTVDYQPYYSANVTYAVRDNMNIRLAYSTSLARPELRELTNIYSFDPFQFAVVGGNPGLQNQLTNSMDFRWEWFTGPNEVWAVSAFSKSISNQLQKVFNYKSQGNLSTSPEFPLVNFQNDPNKGQVYGAEFELRRNLRFISPALKNLFFNANVMLAVSRIDKNPQRLEASRINDRLSPATSPVFEQAPYSINTALDYNNPATKTTVSCNFNIVGARLVQVQLDGTPDIFDRPVPILDLVFAQQLGKYFLLKGFAKNLLDPSYKQVYTNAGNNGKYHGSTYLYRQYKRGSEFSLGIAYRIL